MYGFGGGGFSDKGSGGGRVEILNKGRNTMFLYLQSSLFSRYNVLYIFRFMLFNEFDNLCN